MPDHRRHLPRDGLLESKEAVHGDLKSANVLLDGVGRAKVRVWYCTANIMFRLEMG